jgi:anti-anti-sigma regulatory factor
VPLQMTDQTPSAGLLTVHREGDMDAPFAIIINLPQSLGSREAKKLVRELKMQITDEPPLVIVDLSRVTKMDCAGLDGLLVCMQEIAKHDGAPFKCEPFRPQRLPSGIVRMDRLLDKFASLPAQAPGFAVVPVTTAEGVTPEAVQLRLVAA